MFLLRGTMDEVVEYRKPYVLISWTYFDYDLWMWISLFRSWELYLITTFTVPSRKHNFHSSNWWIPHAVFFLMWWLFHASTVWVRSPLGHQAAKMVSAVGPATNTSSAELRETWPSSTRLGMRIPSFLNRGVDTATSQTRNGFVWKWLVPRKTQWLMIIIPIEWL